MKVIRKDWPKIREVIRTTDGYTYYVVDCRSRKWNGQQRFCFTTQSAAISKAQEISGVVSSQGFDGLNQRKEVIEDPTITSLIQQLQPYDKTLSDAVTHYIGHLEQQQKIDASKTIPELAKLWIYDKSHNKLHPLRISSIIPLTNMGELFQIEWSEYHIELVNRTDVEKWLNDKKDIGNQTRKNYLSYFLQFLNWCKDHNHLHKDINDIVKLKKSIQVIRGVPKFYSVDECKKMFELLHSKYQSCIPYVSLCLFAGIRPEECFATKSTIKRLTWNEINMDTKEITIPPNISKTKKPRTFVMAKNLFAILHEFNKAKKPLCPSYREIREFRLALKEILNKPWIQDGLRHTFATFHYAKDKELEPLRYIMGNSPGIIETFYRGIIPDKDVAAFWSIV